MRHPLSPLILGTWLTCSALGAWSPRVHEAQTAKALRLIPRNMAVLLRAHPQALLEGARGVANDQPPTVEQVEAQFRTILRLSDERRRPEDIVRDLGVLAHLVQLLADPSVVTGISPLRETFEAYAEDRLPHLLVTQEPYWAVTGSLDPTPALRRLLGQKQARYLRLQEHFNEGTAQRIGPWDDLSMPFAQLQLGFSSGVQATANLWILAWRAAGDRWDIPSGP